MWASAWLASASFGKVSIPENLTSSNQQTVLQILGFGSSFKSVDNPYPLGGTEGLEIGFSVESLPISDIAGLGSGASADQNLLSPRIDLGKALFNNFDIFFNFLPYSDSVGVGMYSLALRYGLFQADFVPASFSLLVQGSQVDINDLLISQVYGSDLVIGINVDPVAFYVGFGLLAGQGQFSGAVTDVGTPSFQSADVFHTTLGVNLTLSDYFAAMELDNYATTTALAFKLGTRL